MFLLEAAGTESCLHSQNEFFPEEVLKATDKESLRALLDGKYFRAKTSIIIPEGLALLDGLA